MENIAALLVATNPLLLYFVNTGELYAYDALFSAFAIVLFVVRPKRNITFLYYLYGLAGAFRLSSLILTTPVALFVLWQEYRSERSTSWIILHTTAIVLGVLTWLIPFLVILHGWAPLAEVLGRGSGLPERFIPNLSSWLTSMLWMLNITLVFALFNVRNVSMVARKYIPLALLIVIPSLYFALRVNAKGYTMLCLAPLVLLLAAAFAKVRLNRAVVTVSAATNLLLFFFTPFFRPPDIISREYAMRSFGERMRWSAFRAASFFAPTYEHLRMNDAGNLEARSMLSHIPADATVHFDEASVLWAFPRSLQTDFPAMTFYRTHSSDSARPFAKYHRDEYSEDVPMQHVSPMYYLTTRTFVHAVGTPGELIAQENNLALYWLQSDSDVRLYLKRNAFLDR